MGFLFGALSFFLSAVVTGGVGPWLPFQMFAAAWMGLIAGACVRSRGIRRARPRRDRGAALFGAYWGLLYGAITNLWFWPFWVGGPDVTYQPGIGVFEAFRRYWNFYLLTSLGWDAHEQRLQRPCPRRRRRPLAARAAALQIALHVGDRRCTSCLGRQFVRIAAHIRSSEATACPSSPSATS